MTYNFGRDDDDGQTCVHGYIIVHAVLAILEQGTRGSCLPLASGMKVLSTSEGRPRGTREA